MKPITPEILLINSKNILELEEGFLFVESINNILQQKFRKNQTCFIVLEEDIKNEYKRLLMEKSNLTKTDASIKVTESYDKGYFDFEDYFSNFGWIVSYEQPDRDENFKPHYTFKIKLSK